MCGENSNGSRSMIMMEEKDLMITTKECDQTKEENLNGDELF